MTPQEKEIKNFYDTITFPGLYKSEEVVDYGDYLIYERYLDFLVHHEVTSILDIGCGSGFITNVIAYHLPYIKIVAIDFSDTIQHGKKISKELGIDNVEWRQENFLEFKSNRKFDVVLANGSLHHIPNFDKAVQKAKSFSRKFLMVGLYNKYGKWVQRKIRPKFVTECFELDQTKIPFELSFSHKEVKEKFNDCKLIKVTPSVCGLGVDFFSLFRSKWGGFMFYYFSK